MATGTEDQCDYCGAIIISNVHMHVWERDDGDENVLCVDCMRNISEETYLKEEREAREAKNDKETRDLSDRGTASTTETRTEEPRTRKSRHIQVQGVRSRSRGCSLKHPSRTGVPVRETGESVGGVPAVGGGRGDEYEQEFPDTYGFDINREPHGN